MGQGDSSQKNEICPSRSFLSDELQQRFISFCDASEQSLRTYNASLRQLMRYLRANNIAAPNRADILTYREYLKSKYKPCTVSLYMVAVRLFFRWMQQEGIYQNVADHVKGAKLDRKHKKDYMTAQQIKNVFSTTDVDKLTGIRDYAILALMTTAGLRCIEVTRANVGDIRVSGNGTVLHIQGKGREEKAESVAVPKEVETVIRGYLAHRKYLNDEKPLFASVSNNSFENRLTTRSISRIVKNHMRAAGYDSERWTAHSLRHTAVTLALLSGKTLQEAQIFARHADISTTTIYAHNLDNAQVKTICGKAVADEIF